MAKAKEKPQFLELLFLLVFVICLAVGVTFMSIAQSTSTKASAKSVEVSRYK